MSRAGQIRWGEITLRGVIVGAAEVGVSTVSGKTLREAHSDVLKTLAEQGIVLRYCCSRCRTPIGTSHKKCWACGAQVGPPSLVKRVRPDLRRVAGVGRLSELDAEQLVKRLRKAIPKGWKVYPAVQHTTFWDKQGVRRIAVYRRGLAIQFSVPDGFFGEDDEVEFVSPADRVRRHLGRVSYIYTGAIQRDAFQLCHRVMQIKES